MKLSHTILLLLAFPFCLSANTNSTSARINYIEQFSNAAMSEMNRSGVPASIILAQGIVESNAGRSQLSLESLNHFGIKCKNWTGRKVYYKDDDYDKDGNLIKSCFRAYDTVLDSYADHSDFLKNGRRYQKLFDLNPTDYRGWAYGLKECGYATNPKYATMLINIIEKYALFIYDLPHENVVAEVFPAPQPNKIDGIAQNHLPQPIDNKPIVNSLAILETPTYQLPNSSPKEESIPKKRITRKIAMIQVRAADRPMMHGISTR